MKRILFMALGLIFSACVYAQTVIENPRIGMSTASNVAIEKVELSNVSTAIWFYTKNTPGRWISIPNETYIQPVGAKEKLYITSAEGIPLGEQYTMPESGEVRYKLTFPKIDPSFTRLDYGEGNDEGAWFIFDIQLKPDLFQSVLPEKLLGNWFRSDNAQWEISLLDSVAVYKSQIWKYVKYSETQKTGKISLKNGSQNLDMYIQPVDENTSLIGEAPAKLVKYSRQPDESKISADNETFKLPILKTDTVTYCGYINGFSTRYPQRTGMVYVNDVIIGEQLSYLIKIEDNGTFKVKFPHSNPQTVYVRFPFFYGTIFVEPGKTTFQLFDNSNKSNPLLFMGDCARINSELQKMKDIYSFDYNELYNKILDFTPEQYKTWCIDLQKKDLAALDKYASEHHLSAKTIQVKRMELVYRYASNIMSYNSNANMAYRQKNNVPQNQNGVPFKSATLDAGYFSFLTNDLVNNQLGVLSSDYDSFVNRLKFSDILIGDPVFIHSIPEIAEAMEKEGYKLTPEEKDLAIQMKEIDSPEMKKLRTEFSEKYSNQSADFYKKYASKLQPLYQEKKGTAITPEMIEEYLVGQKVELTEEEKALFAAQKEYAKNPLVQKYSEFYQKYNKQISQFSNDHQAFVSGMFTERRIVLRNESLQKMGIQHGFAADVMASQDYCQPIVSQMTPVSDEKIKSYQKKITNPFIASYIDAKNKEAKAKIEANKNLKGSNLNEVPKAEGDKLFDAIMAKYKGKVVYVDFWATWCAPCRSGIEQIKPLKDELANENVVFVYITGPSSPKSTYDYMIPAIKGEHYRVSADEWNFLCGKFGISGIPHYVLVGKDGNVINPKLGHLQNESLKNLLMKYIKE